MKKKYLKNSKLFFKLYLFYMSIKYNYFTKKYTYSQFGRRVLEQPDQKAWQIFDSKVTNRLYDEYHFKEAPFEEAVSIAALLKRIEN